MSNFTTNLVKSGETSEVLDEVREHIQRAAALLRTLGQGYDRVGWVLEDALMYLSPSELSDDFEETAVPSLAGCCRPVLKPEVAAK